MAELQEMAREWLENHKPIDPWDATFWSRHRCTFCIDTHKIGTMYLCRHCKLYGHLGMSCMNFLKAEVGSGWYEQMALAWAICQDLANGGEDPQ